MLQRHRMSFNEPLLTHDGFVARLRECARAWAGLGNVEQHDRLVAQANCYAKLGEKNCPVCRATTVGE